jgi:hypothetical protein
LATSSCPACGATIQHARLHDGTNVPLEVFTEPTGSKRYRIIEAHADTGVQVERVRDDAPIDAFPDHRKDCPGYGNGLDT